MRFISRTLARVFDASSTLQNVESSVLTVYRPSLLHGSSRKAKPVDAPATNFYLLPPKSKALELLQKFFSNTGLLFPFLHEETFFMTYAELESKGYRGVRRTWLGLLNMVLALATSTAVGVDSNAEKRMEQSEEYYRRALGLCDKQMMSLGNLEVGTYCLSWLSLQTK